MWDVMFWPIVACVLLPWLLVYLGLHVVQRGIIFIDIAMAQMASLGICVAVLFHLNLESPATFAIALGFTLAGAAIFSVTGKRTSQVPQEAVIGIAYVVAAAASVLLLSRAAEGDEQIKQMLVGNILLVTPLEVWKCFGLFAIVGLLHFALRRNFLLVSYDRDGAYEKGLRVRWWDFLFYAAFGLVVTSFVRIAGVLLVFSYLIVPAVCGINLAGSLGRRLLIGWLIALIGGVGGLPAERAAHVQLDARWPADRLGRRRPGGEDLARTQRFLPEDGATVRSPVRRAPADHPVDGPAERY
jgi:zinc/manganese transport system permease protein